MTTLRTPGHESREFAAAGPAVIAACIAVAAVAAPIVAFAVSYELAAVAAVAIMLAAGIAVRPQFGAYLYLIATPLIVGIARGSAMPILRPNEALIALILLGVGIHVLFIMLQGRRYPLKFDGVDLAFLLLAFCASALPMALRWGRGEVISAEDLLYALVLWKYYLVYRIFRESISTPEQVSTCLWLSMASASLVAIVALFQVNNLLGVPKLLHTYFDNPFQDASRIITERGTSTIASSFGVADTMMLNLGIVMVLLSQRHPSRLLLCALAGIFVLGCIAAGQFSGFIGLAVMIFAVGILTGRLRQTMMLAVPAACIAAVLLWPVVAERLSGFQSVAGLPNSWVNRLVNLERFFLQELFSDLNWLTGVRPAARVAAPEPWREWVYIESGYLWLLWTGGVPLVAAFALFVWTAQRRLRRVIRDNLGPGTVAATVSLAWIITMATLMILDPHLTMRGAADLFFPLLALSFAGLPQGRKKITDDRRGSGEAG